ncbi:MAG: hypothetical protein AB7D39_17285 [Pseudodesulfovibrio sp.]|uniref:hypothetical protein n=1 Tax=Pseudodesulfovibrio sp. TaxID=2035812 RepID=UPI003D10393A
MNCKPQTNPVPGVVRDIPTTPIEVFTTCREVPLYDGQLSSGTLVENYGTYANVTGKFQDRDISLRVDYDVANWIVRTAVKNKKTIGAAPYRELLVTKVTAHVPALGGDLLCGSLIMRVGNRYGVSAFIQKENGNIVPNGTTFDKKDGEKLVAATKAKPHCRRPTASICALGV